jgi:hypothetical protein
MHDEAGAGSSNAGLGGAAAAPGSGGGGGGGLSQLQKILIGVLVPVGVLALVGLAAAALMGGRGGDTLPDSDDSVAVSGGSGRVRLSIRTQQSPLVSLDEGCTRRSGASEGACSQGSVACDCTHAHMLDGLSRGWRCIVSNVCMLCVRAVLVAEPAVGPGGQHECAQRADDGRVLVAQILRPSMLQPVPRFAFPVFPSMEPPLQHNFGPRPPQFPTCCVARPPHQLSGCEGRGELPDVRRAQGFTMHSYVRARARAQSCSFCCWACWGRVLIWPAGSGHRSLRCGMIWGLLKSATLMHLCMLEMSLSPW